MGGLIWNDKKPKNPQMGDVVLDDFQGVMVWDQVFNNWVPIKPPNHNYRRDRLLDEFEKNPDLYNEIMVEMRNRKINNIMKK